MQNFSNFIERDAFITEITSQLSGPAQAVIGLAVIAVIAHLLKKYILD